MITVNTFYLGAVRVYQLSDNLKNMSCYLCSVFGSTQYLYGFRYPNLREWKYGEKWRDTNNQYQIFFFMKIQVEIKCYQENNEYSIFTEDLLK